MNKECRGWQKGLNATGRGGDDITEFRLQLLIVKHDMMATPSLLKTQAMYSGSESVQSLMVHVCRQCVVQ